mgnify:CR=1 FL=1
MIDFSHISCVDALLDTCVEKNLPLVLCTTGLQEAHLAHAEAAWQKIVSRAMQQDFTWEKS